MVCLAIERGRVHANRPVKACRDPRIMRDTVTGLLVAFTSHIDLRMSNILKGLLRIKNNLHGFNMIVTHP